MRTVVRLLLCMLGYCCRCCTELLLHGAVSRRCTREWRRTESCKSRCTYTCATCTSRQARWDQSGWVCASSFISTAGSESVLSPAHTSSRTAVHAHIH